jgi:hypothetical protein
MITLTLLVAALGLAVVLTRGWNAAALTLARREGDTASAR